MDEEEEVKTEYCSNCKRDIPAANFVMHVNHCQRNLMLCKECGEPIPISQQEEHFEEYHAEEQCECGELVEKINLDDHKEKDCPNRKVECEYCELTLPFSKMSSHVEYCGSRTQNCDACHRFIQIKDFTEHENSGCQYPIKEESKQLPQSKPRHEIFSGVPVDMFNGMGEIDSSDAEYRFNPFLAAINGFGQILTSGLGTPPFSDAHMNPRGGAAHYGFDENGMFGKHGVVSRGASKGQGSQNPEADHRNFQDFDEINDEYAVDVDDDEILAAAYQADEFGYIDGDSEWMSAAEVDKHVPYTKSTLLPDSDNLDKTQLPCEFCGNLFSVESLILHQSGCQLRSLDSISGVAPPFGGNRRNRHNLPQYDDSVYAGVERRNSFERELQNNRTELDKSERKCPEDDTFLPCEFCQELFPFDNLILHQAVCDAGPASRAPSTLPPLNNSPSALFDGSTQGPLPSKTRPIVRIGSKSRPSRPVYESKRRSPKSWDDFIPGDLDSRELTPENSSPKVNFTPDDGRAPGRDVRHKSEKYNDRTREPDNVPMNNALKRPERKTRESRPIRGQPVLRNNDLVTNKPPRDLVHHGKDRMVHSKELKRQPESRSDASTFHKTSAARLREDDSYLVKTNSGSKSSLTTEVTKPPAVRQIEITAHVKSRQAGTVNERSRRHFEHKMGIQNHRSEETRSKLRPTDTSSSASRVSTSVSNRTKPTGQLPQFNQPSFSVTGSSAQSSSSYSRRNPPAIHLPEREIRPNRGKPRSQGHPESVRPSNTPASTAPRKSSSTRKKIV